MPLKTLLLYLLGNREAIERVARDKSAIWYGLFFALVSGVAREYDQESLFHKGYIFLLPVLLTPPLALLYYGFLKLKHLPRKGPNGLRCFFGLFWMTAPLGWLYALPVESLFTPLTALKLNAALLALVSLWRVVLFARVVSVLLRQRYWQVCCGILWGGAILVFVASFLYGFQLTEIMGGTVHSQESAFKEKIAWMTNQAAGILALVLLIVQFIPGKPRIHFPAQDLCSPRRLLFPGLLLAVSAIVLVTHQPALYRSQKAFVLVDRHTTVAKGLDYLSQFTPADFAHTWPLPPAARSEPLRLRRAKYMLTELQPEHAPWISEHVIDYISLYLTHREEQHHHSMYDLPGILALLPENEQAHRFFVKHQDQVKQVLSRELQNIAHHRLEDLRAVIARLHDIPGVFSPEELLYEHLEESYKPDTWQPHEARTYLLQASLLPETDTANAWLTERVDAFQIPIDAMRSANTNMFQAVYTNLNNRLQQSGITLAP